MKRKEHPKQSTPPERIIPVTPRAPVPEPPYYGYPEEEMKEAEKLARELSHDGFDVWAEMMASLERGRQAVLEAHEAQDAREKLLAELDEMEKNATFWDKFVDFCYTVWDSICHGLWLSWRYVGRFAVIFLAVIGALTIVVGSVRALREPVISFLVEHYEKFSTITFTGDGTVASSDPVDADEVFDPLAGLLPEGYELIESNMPSSSVKMAIYTNTEFDHVSYYIRGAVGEIRIDGEDSENCTKFNLHGCDAYLLEKDGYQIIWYNASTGLSYQLCASGLNYEQLLAIAHALCSTTNC